MRVGTPGFIGEKLKEGREARALTAVALADLAGVTAASISQYERGQQSPSPAVLRSLSDSLNLPLAFFLEKRPASKAGVVFYRSMSAATKKARKRAERRYEWLRDIVGLIEQHIDLPAINIPELSIPSDPVQINDNLVEEAATKVRRNWGLGDGPISNVAWLLETNGIVVSRCQLGAATLDAFSEWRDGTRTPYVILSSEKDSAVRSRYDAAHELGHLVLHRWIDRSCLVDPAVFKVIESQAHRFAGAFLLPGMSFANDLKLPTLDGMRALKSKWQVSIAAMIKRAADLQLVSEHAESRLWINMGRRKWKTREPLDDQLSPETPSFLRRSIMLLIDNGVIAPNAIAAHLSLSPHDIEELTGLESGYLMSAGVTPQLKAESKHARTIKFPYPQ